MECAKPVLNSTTSSEVGPARLEGPALDPQLAAVGPPAVQQFSWLSRFGPMLIEVRVDAIYVNGQRVEQAPPNL